MSDTNDQLVLIGGYSSMGKSASLMNIRNKDKWIYLNSESGKKLPFKNNFDSYRIEDPLQVMEAFDYATTEVSVEGLILDSLTFLMDMYETQYIIPAANGMKAWSDFAQFFKVMMQQKVVAINKPVIMTAHVLDVLDEKNMEMRTSVPIKGSLKNQGVEAYFSTIVYAKRLPLKELKGYENSMLTITEDDQINNFKHVFQTRVTKSTTGERIRSPMGMFSREETFINNDAQMLLDFLKEYYK